MKRQYFRMHDVDNRGAFPIEPGEAKGWNKQGFGIFWTVNEFLGARRIEKLVRINSWAIDMDEGTKEEQKLRIERSPLVPSGIVETKRGFQVYWTAKDAKPEHWNAVLIDRLVPFFGADANARDLARILRVPGFFHLKNPAEPFLVRVVFSNHGSYTETQMATAFPDSAKAKRDAVVHAAMKREHKFEGDTFWDAVYEIDCEDGLLRLSGHSACGGEHFTFRQNSNGNKNILVDGKGSSAWVDQNGRIGSLSKGGPTLFQWLRWYNNTPRDCAEIIKSIYPELRNK